MYYPVLFCWNICRYCFRYFIVLIIVFMIFIFIIITIGILLSTHFFVYSGIQCFINLFIFTLSILLNYLHITVQLVIVSTH